MSTTAVVYGLCTIGGGVIGAFAADKTFNSGSSARFGMDLFVTGAGAVFGGVSGMASAGIILRMIKK